MLIKELTQLLKPSEKVIIAEQYEESTEFDNDMSKIEELMKKVEKLIHSANMNQHVSDTDFNYNVDTAKHHKEMVKKLREFKQSVDAFYEEMQNAE